MIRIAAVLVVLIGGTVTVRQMRPTRSGDQAAHLIADDLTDLTTDELRAVLASFDEIVSESVVPDSTSDLQELDAQQLRQLLREG